jgi:hypothetical protein
MNTIACFYQLRENRFFIHKYKAVLIFLFLAITFIQNSISQTLAFPEAYGFGSNASGGRGGAVIKVTNLNNSGSGSLRYALEDATGTRTVVFEVGGTINLTDNIYISNGDLTIAGQTAPGDGILIKGGMIQIEDSNVIIRYLSVRPGTTASSSADAISVTAWSGSLVEDVIIDHCSFSWAKDENVNIRTTGSGIARNITVQNSLIAECGYAFLAAEGSYNVSVYKNLFVLNGDRHIRGKGFSNTEFAFEQINNLVYGFQRGGNVALGARFSNISNHYKLSNQVSFLSSNLIGGNDDGGITSNTYAYISGNIAPEGVNEFDTDFNSYLQITPFTTTNIIPIQANEVESDLIGHVGNSYPTRDSVDERLVNNWNNGNGSLATNGTYPNIQGGSAPEDTDNDGMPNFWEDDNGLNKNDPSDRNVIQSDGYTNLEYYLNGLFFLTDGPNANAGQDQNICDGQTASLTATGGDTYLWNTGETTASINVNPNTTTTFTVTAFVGGESDTDNVVVNVYAIPTANAGADQTICAGETISLTATGGSSYLWNTGATSPSISVSPNNTATYSVTVTQNGCTDTDDVVVTVNPSPTANAGNDVSILEGESTTLSASGGDIYLWSTGETTQSITVTPNTTTTYSATAFIGSCEDADDVIVTVNSQVAANAGEDVTICENSSTILTASGGTEYLWNTGATTQSINISPNTTTTYSVTVSNGNSSDTDDVVVTVDPNPLANAGSDVTISEGESTTLVASGGDSYLWSTGETTQSIMVTPNSTTTYTVIAILNSCEDSDDIIVNVDTEQVVANAGADVGICEGDSITLTASGGTDYLWSTGETTQSIIVNPNTTTNYTVIVSNESSSDTDDVTVDVNPVPEVSLSNDTTILEGNYITLSASGADNYEWSNGALQPNIAVSPDVTTTYVVTGYINNCYDVKDVTVSVVEQVFVDAGEDVFVCLGDGITLSASGSGAEDYLWNTGATTQSITVNPEEDTLYTIMASNSLDSDSDEIMVTVNSCHEEEILPEDEIFSVKAYIDSRISDEILNIKLTGLVGQSALYLFDISGKLIHNDEFDGNDGHEVVRTINKARISDGVYIIKVTNDNNDHSKSIIIQ